MQVLKEDVRKRISEAAMDEFAEKGYDKSSMVKIAEAANVAVGNIYHYYKSKNKLFYSITDPVYTRISKLIRNAHPPDFENSNRVAAFITNLGTVMAATVKKHKRELIILFDGSRGTVHEDAKEKFISILKKKLMVEYRKQYEDKLLDIKEPFIVHIFAANIIEGYHQIIKHSKGNDWIDNVTLDYIKYNLMGFSGFFAKTVEQEPAE